VERKGRAEKVRRRRKKERKKGKGGKTKRRAKLTYVDHVFI